MPDPSRSFEVEPATSADSIAIAHLNVWAYREFSVDLGAEVWPEVVRRLTNLDTADGDADFLVVREDGNPVGSVAFRPAGRSVKPVPASWASVDLLAVSPANRRAGVGRALVQACIDRAGPEAAILGAIVGGHMSAAQGLFSSMGFHREQGLTKRGAPPYWFYRKEL